MRELSIKIRWLSVGGGCRRVGRVLVACFVLYVGVAFAQGTLATSTKPIAAENVVGEWKPTFEGADNCVTRSFTIRPSNLSAPGRDLYAVELRQCSANLYELNYVGSLFQRVDRMVVAFKPTEGSSTPEAIKLIEPQPGLATYNADRLTLWLSTDACDLDGWRKDRSNAWNEVTLHKSDCPNQ